MKWRREGSVRERDGKREESEEEEDDSEQEKGGEVIEVAM